MDAISRIIPPDPQRDRLEYIIYHTDTVFRLGEQALEMLARQVAEATKALAVRMAWPNVTRIGYRGLPDVVGALIDFSHNGSTNAAAQDMGVPQRTLHRIVRGHTKAPSPHVLQKIAQFYGVPTQDFYARIAPKNLPRKRESVEKRLIRSMEQAVAIKEGRAEPSRVTQIGEF